MTDPTRDRPKADLPGQDPGVNLTNQSLADADREALYPPSPYADEQMQAINAASTAIRRFLDRSAPDVSRLVFNADCDEMAQVALDAAGKVTGTAALGLAQRQTAEQAARADRLEAENAALHALRFAAQRWRAQFEKPADTKLPRMAALIAAVDALPAPTRDGAA